MVTQAEYNEFIEGIDNSVAGTDEYGNLAWHIDSTATSNADNYEDMIATARMALDCWEDFYPQLIK